MKRIVPALSLLVLTHCAHAAPAPEPSASPAPAMVDAAYGTLRPVLELPGEIAPYRNVGISSALTEPAVAVDVRAGDRVRAGQRLAQLATDDLTASLASAQATAAQDRALLAAQAGNSRVALAQTLSNVRITHAALLQARATLGAALLDRARARQLVSQGYLAEQVLDQQSTTVAADRQAVVAAEAAADNTAAAADANGSMNSGLQAANLDAVRANVAAAEAAVEELRRQMSRATIVAPADGQIVNVNLNPGEYPAGRQIFTLHEDEHVYAVLNASSAQAFALVRGASASVVPAGESRAFAGSLVAVLPQAVPGSTNFTVTVDVPNFAHALHAGMPVRARVAMPAASGIVIPVSAFLDDNRDRVLVGSPGGLHTVPVTVLARAGGSAIVRGLDAGTRVVADGSAH